MPHSVAPINAAVRYKSKAVFRLPTVRRHEGKEEHKEEGKYFCPLSYLEIHAWITDKNILLLFVIFLHYWLYKFRRHLLTLILNYFVIIK
jgi:hypothetical protein